MSTQLVNPQDETNATTVPSQLRPSSHPSSVPPMTQSESPSDVPSSTPSLPPSNSPSANPSALPSLRPTLVSYVPGDLSIVTEHGLRLSTGLTATLIAKSGQPVAYTSLGSDEARSSTNFHQLPDFGATFVDRRRWNPGGWIYVSNSEVRDGHGGVGALTFDRHGHVMDYRMILRQTAANCGGGRTPWGSWISCEEHDHGQNWQVDPTGQRVAQPITLGSDDRGNFESFAYDARQSHYFVTEDHEFGPLRRFVPDAKTNSWDELHGPGTTSYLRLVPSTGRFEWTADQQQGRLNANAFYPNAEGIDVVDNQLFFVSKTRKTMFVLNLDDATYTSHTTRRGVFDGQPDQIVRLLDDNNNNNADDTLLYFTEDGGATAGVHARDGRGRFYVVVDGWGREDETTGLAFSPDALHLYVAWQEAGMVFDITRQDGLPFHAKTLNVKYHHVSAE